MSEQTTKIITVVVENSVFQPGDRVKLVSFMPEETPYWDTTGTITKLTATVYIETEFTFPVESLQETIGPIKRLLWTAHVLFDGTTTEETIYTTHKLVKQEN